MIEIVTGKDLQDVWTKVQELIERTKNHTKQIHELQSKIGDLLKSEKEEMK
jgi:hypothetical protein